MSETGKCLFASFSYISHPLSLLPLPCPIRSSRWTFCRQSPKPRPRPSPPHLTPLLRWQCKIRLLLIPSSVRDINQELRFTPRSLALSIRLDINSRRFSTPDASQLPMHLNSRRISTPDASRLPTHLDSKCISTPNASRLPTHLDS